MQGGKSKCAFSLERYSADREGPSSLEYILSRKEKVLRDIIPDVYKEITARFGFEDYGDEFLDTLKNNAFICTRGGYSINNDFEKSILIIDYDSVNKDYISAEESILYCAISEYVISNICFHMRKIDDRYERDTELSKNDLDVEYCKDVLNWTFIYLKTIGDKLDSMCIEEEKEYVDDLFLLARTSLEDYDFSSGNELENLRQTKLMKKNKDQALSVIKYFISEYRSGSINFSDLGIFFKSFEGLYSFLDDPKDKFGEIKEDLREHINDFDVIFEEAVVQTRIVLDYLGVGKKYEDYSFYLEEVISGVKPIIKSADNCIDIVLPISYNSIEYMVGTMLYGICNSKTGSGIEDENHKEIVHFFSEFYCHVALDQGLLSDVEKAMLDGGEGSFYEGRNAQQFTPYKKIDRQVKKHIKNALNTGSFDSIRDYAMKKSYK